MPEIPEMENYRKMVATTVVGKLVISVTVERPRSINIAPEEFDRALVGQSISGVGRRAKYISLETGAGMYLIAHMMLDGRLYYGPAGTSEGMPGKPHVILNFADGNSLFFCDMRLGFVHLLTRPGLEQELAGLGIEPLSPEFTPDAFTQVFRKRRGAIKPLLLDQKLVCGIGNAYSNEILFAAGIMPDRTVPSLDESAMSRLWQAIPRVLREAIANGGYIEEPYAAWDKLSGGQIPHFMVYDRGGEPCKVCGTVIQEGKLNGRWTYFCTRCQQ